jgi:hypothetical protein
VAEICIVQRCRGLPWRAMAVVLVGLLVPGIAFADPRFALAAADSAYGAGDRTPAGGGDAKALSMETAAPAQEGVRILPGSWLYGIKRWLEDLRLVFMRDAAKKADYLGVLVERRSAEIHELVARGRAGMVGIAAGHQEKLLKRASEQLEGVTLTEKTKGVFAHIEEATREALRTLEQVVIDLPQKARGAVEEAAGRLAQEARNLLDMASGKAKNEDKAGGGEGSQGKPPQGKGQPPK